MPTPARQDTIDAGEEARRTADRERAERERLAREARERTRLLLGETIHFELDRSDLTEPARASLDGKLEVLRTQPGIRLRIEGHADERGSDEYNLALGMRRAAAVRRYLMQHGVDERRINIVSMGEERPICHSSTENCWWQNRRAEFVVADE